MSIMANRHAVRTYADGNTVRKVRPQRQSRAQAEAVRRNRLDRERILTEREMDHRAQQERLRSKTAVMDIPYLAMLILASCCTLFLCFNYINLKTQINSRISSIEQKEQQLDKLKSENNALQNSIDTSVDLNEIYRVATQELGMVYAGEKQVITYDKTESEYVRQYEDIPKY